MRLHMLASLALGSLAVGSLAIAQPCDPHWDRALGNPGIADGYVAPMRAWDDGGGEKLYVGGSFTRIGGGARRYLARFDPATSAWSILGSGINPGNTNAFITSLQPYNPGSGEMLVVGGFYRSAGGVNDTRSIAAWNGSAWSSLGTGWTVDRADSVWAMEVFNEELVIGGGFADVGGAAGNGLAAWSGSGWRALGSGIAGSFAPVVFALKVFDDGNGPRLYAAGRFDSVDGHAASMIARTDGGTWEPVGGGLIAESVLFGLEALVIFDDGSGPALYAAGGQVRVPGNGSFVSCVKWDGSSWEPVGQNLGGRTTALAVFDDGSGPVLYGGGTAQPGVEYFYMLENGAWTPAHGAVGDPAVPPANFPSVFGLGVWGDRLLVGGNFGSAGGEPASGIAAWVGCDACIADFNDDGQLNLFDFLAFQTAFGIDDPAADINADGLLNLFDFLAFQTAFGVGC